ncbi:MAG: thioesterase family protein [Deltaproteobacteria bacterium]
MRLTKQVRVRFGHADPARIVYYPRFFEWFHDTFETWFDEVLQINYAEVLNGRRVGFPTVQVATEFKEPARFGEVVDVQMFLSRLTDRSATVEYRVYRDGRLLATASVKVVAMNLDEHTSTTIPGDIRTAFEPYVEENADPPNTARLYG